MGVGTPFPNLLLLLQMVFMEPRGSAGKKKFESLMADFDSHVEEGALLLAVCRVIHPPNTAPSSATSCL